MWYNDNRLGIYRGFRNELGWSSYREIKGYAYPQHDEARVAQHLRRRIVNGEKCSGNSYIEKVIKFKINRFCKIL